MARRVNTKFLTVLTVVVVGLGILALVANKFLVHESPEKYITAGHQYTSDKKYEEAVKAFARAVSLDQRNANVWVAYGDALNQLSGTDIEYMRRARTAWDQALAVEPNNMPALDRMMQFWSDVANLSANDPKVFDGLSATAQKLYAADPKNSAAKIAVQTSIIRPWLAGVEKPEQQIRDTLAKLKVLMVEFPENPDLPMFTAQGDLRLAERDRQREQHDEANKLIKEADDIMLDAVKRSPTAAMYFSAAQVAQVQEGLAGSARVPSKAATQPAITSAEWRKRRLELYTKARELAKPEDPLYVFIHIAAARASADDNPLAEKILRDLLAKQPDDQQVRLALAEQLAIDQTQRKRDLLSKQPDDQQVRLSLAEQLAIDQARRKEAIEILDRPFATTNLKGPRAYLIRELQIRTLIMATNLRLDQFANLVSSNAPKDQRDQLLSKIQDSLAMIEAKDTVESARPLRLRGKLLRLQGETIKAIQTLEKARSLAEKNRDMVESQDRLDRWEVLDLLARAYIETQQTGRAKQLLTELAYRFPTYEPAQMLLAQLLIKEGLLDDARPRVAFLKQRHPDDPEIIKLELQLLDPKGINNNPKTDVAAQKQQLKETYSKLPEGTKAQILEKVTAAMAVEQQDDALRLLDKAQSQSPGDFDVARMGVKVYRFLGDLEKAKAFVDVAFKANPKDEKLQVLQKQVQDLSPDALLATTEEEIKKNPDPFQRAIGMATISRRKNQPVEELNFLREAQRLQPQNTDVTALTFKYYMRQQQFDKAEMLLEPLSAANQDQAGGLLFRYQLDMVRGDYPKALDHARQLVQRMGEFGQSWLALGQALQATNQMEDALAKYLTAVEKQSESPEALRGVIECYYALSRPAEARRYIDRARRALPANADFKEMEIQHELSFGDPERAIPAREETARKNAEKPNAVLQLGQAYLASARSRQAKAANPSKPPAEMFTKAKAIFKQGLTKWPDEIAFYAYYAETSARSGVLDDSEQLLKQLAARDAWKNKSEPQALLAEFYAIAQRPADSEAVFRELLKKDPANTDVQVRLANLLVSQNKVNDALTTLEANIQDPRVARRRVEILISADRTDEADKVVAEALEKSPSNLELLHLGAGVDMDHRRFDRAEKRLTRALEIDPANATSHYYFGSLRMKQLKPDFNAAIEELRKGKDSPTMGTEARFALAECMRRKGDPDGAMREMEGALSSQPGNFRVRLGLIDAYLASQPPRWVDAERVIKDAKALPGYSPRPDMLEREASMWYARNDPAKALAAMQEARTTAPNDVNIVRKLIAMLLKQGKYPQVNQEAEALIARDKNLWWAYQARAVSRRFQGNKEDAIKDFDTALATANTLRDDNAADEIIRTMGDVIGPDEVINRLLPRAEKDNHFKLLIARLQSTKGDNESALKTIEQVLAQEQQLLPSDREQALRFGAMLYLVLHQPDKSSKCYESLLKLSPDDLISLNNMACLLAETVQPPRPHDGLPYAEHAYKLMQASGRKDPIVMDTYGLLLVLCGKVDEGIDVLRAANDIRQVTEVHYHLGEAYLLKGFVDQAQQELTLALDMVKSAIQQKATPDQSLLELQGKIEGAMGRAALLASKKKASANAATGTNVP